MPRQGLGFGRQVARRGGPRQDSRGQRQRQRTGAPRRRRSDRARERPPDADADDEMEPLSSVAEGSTDADEREGVRPGAVVGATGRTVNSTAGDPSPVGPVSDLRRSSFRAFGFGDDGASSSAGESEEFEEVDLDSESSSNEGEESEGEGGGEIVDPGRNQFDALAGEGSESEDDMESVALSEPEWSESESESSASLPSLNEPASEAEESESQSDDDDDDAVRCAICFLKDDQTHEWRRLTHLPCCGGDGREATSTTRFCAACLLQLARRAVPRMRFRGGGLSFTFPVDEYPVHSMQHRQLRMPERIFYQDDCQTDERRFVVCPRCKGVLVVDVKKKEGSRQGPYDFGDGDWTNPQGAESISLRRPTFKGRCRLAGKKMGAARILWRAALLNPDYLTVETLAATEADVALLLRWRILHRVAGDANAFRIIRQDHSKLIDLLNDCWTADVIWSEQEHYLHLSLGLLNGLRKSIVDDLVALRLRTALRLMGRLTHYCFFVRGPVLTPCSEGRELGISAIIVAALGAVGYVAIVSTVWLAGSSRAFVLAAIHGFAHACSRLNVAVLGFVRSIPPATITFGLVCGASGFACGQRHPTLTWNDALRLGSLRMASAEETSADALRTAERCARRSIFLAGKTVELTMRLAPIFIGIPFGIAASLFNFLSTQLAIVMALVEAKLK